MPCSLCAPLGSMALLTRFGNLVSIWLLESSQLFHTPIGGYAFEVLWYVCVPPHRACARSIRAHKPHRVDVERAATPDHRAVPVVVLLGASHRYQRRHS